MRSAKVFVNKTLAGRLVEEVPQRRYIFIYDDHYTDSPVSLTMPLTQKIYAFNQFPPFFEGLLPEGQRLEALLRKAKLDRYDYFGQLLQVGHDLVGAVSLEPES